MDGEWVGHWEDAGWWMNLLKPRHQTISPVNSLQSLVQVFFIHYPWAFWDVWMVSATREWSSNFWAAPGLWRSRTPGR